MDEKIDVEVKGQKGRLVVLYTRAESKFVYVVSTYRVIDELRGTDSPLDPPPRTFIDRMHLLTAGTPNPCVCTSSTFKRKYTATTSPDGNISCKFQPAHDRRMRRPSSNKRLAMATIWVEVNPFANTMTAKITPDAFRIQNCVLTSQYNKCFLRVAGIRNILKP